MVALVCFWKPAGLEVFCVSLDPSWRNIPFSTVEREHNTGSRGPEMTGRIVLYMLACGAFVLALAAWVKLYLTWQRQSPYAYAERA
jgi:hypothetical protein